VAERFTSSFSVSVDYRFDVDDWGLVDGFQIAHMESATVDREDGYTVEANRIGPIRGARAEDTLLGVVPVTSGMDRQDVSVGSIEPRQENDVRACLEVAQTLADLFVENEPRVRRAFVALKGCTLDVGQG